MTTHLKPLHLQALGILVCSALSAACAQAPSDDGSYETSDSPDAQSPAVSSNVDAGGYVYADTGPGPYVPPAPVYDAGYVAPTPTAIPKFDAGSPTDQLVGVFGSFANAIPGIFGGGSTDGGSASTPDAGDAGH